MLAIEQGRTLRPVCVNKASFFHPLESDGVAILGVTEAKAETITMADDDGWAATNKDGSEKTRKVFVLGGGHRLDEVTPNVEITRLEDEVRHYKSLYVDQQNELRELRGELVQQLGSAGG